MIRKFVIGALCLLGCDTGGDETGLGIDLYTAEGQGALLDGTGADIIELVIVNAEDPFAQPLKEEVSIVDGKGSIGPLPVGESYQLFARGYRGSENTPRFYGATLPRFGRRHGRRRPFGDRNCRTRNSSCSRQCRGSAHQPS